MKRALIFLIVVLTLSFHGFSMDYTGRWLDNYGDYTLHEEGKNDYRVKRAFTVFERVMQAVDKGTSTLPRLAVIAYRKGGYSWALPDGGVIINPGTLDLCYGRALPGKVDNEKLKEGDPLLALIFGHELAHLANRDFMYQEALEALKNFGQEEIRQELEEELKLPGTRAKELFADPQGVIFAAMAGYEIGPLLEEQNNFLLRLAKSGWHPHPIHGQPDGVLSEASSQMLVFFTSFYRILIKKTRKEYTYDGDSKHPSFSKRYEFLRSRLKWIIDQLGLFKAGVLLLQMGNYIDAAAAFRKFSNFYPSREVFNNLGVCYLNSALRYLRLRFSDDYFRFRLSTSIDYHTSAEKLYSRGEGDYLKDGDIASCIDQAVLYFREASYRDRHDKTCRLNLAAALILKKNYAAALAECDLLLEKNQQDVDALNNKAVALYYYGKEICNCAPQKAFRLLEYARLACREIKKPPAARGALFEKTAPLDPPQKLLINSMFPRTGLPVEANHFEVLYNRAALARETKQPDKAKSLWKKYLNLPGIPRDNFYTYICNELGRKEQPPSLPPTPLPAVPEEIKLGEESTPLLKKLVGENFREYKLTGEEKGPDGWSVTLQVITKQNLWILAWEGYIVLVEQELIRPGDPIKLLERCGPPRKMIRHTSGTFYIYEEKGFSLKEVEGMICSYIWFRQQE
jgi:tetratricopeptide (TPR) repeat protein